MIEKESEESGVMSHVKMQAVIYICGLIAIVAGEAVAPQEQKVVVLGMMITAILGGQNLVKTKQGAVIDKKVDTDVKTTKTIASALNGGFDERVERCVERVLADKLPAAIAKALTKHDGQGPPPGMQNLGGE